MDRKGGSTSDPFAWFRNPLQTPKIDKPPVPQRPARQGGILTRLREILRRKHYSTETEKSYVAWVRRFIRFHELRHPREMGADEVTAFLENLAVQRRVSAKTQNLALSAIVFFYRNVLERELEGVRQTAGAKVKRRLPVVLTQSEARAVLAQMRSTPQLVAQLLYGSGLRLREALRLRVKDVEFDTPTLIVREGKGGKDRVCILPRSLIEPLRHQVDAVRRLHERDVAVGAGFVELPQALAVKYRSASRSLPWQWIFPATKIYAARENGERRRHFLHPTAVQREVRRAALAAGITKHVTSHTFRHSFATELLNANVDIRTIQQLLGHKDLKTTMLYTHLSQKAALRVESPMDRIGLIGGEVEMEGVAHEELVELTDGAWDEDEFDE